MKRVVIAQTRADRAKSPCADIAILARSRQHGIVRRRLDRLAIARGAPLKST